MSQTSDRRFSVPAPATATARGSASQVSALLQEAADLIRTPGAPLSALIGFHERKAALFEALAAQEPENPERREAAESSRAQLEHLRAMAERGFA